MSWQMQVAENPETSFGVIIAVSLIHKVTDFQVFINSYKSVTKY